MSFHKWIGEDSDHTGEYIQIEKLSAVLTDWARASRQTVHLLTNFWLGNEEIDAAIILPNSIILIELKTGSGKIKGSENGPWYFVENKQRVALNVGRKNPLNQCRRKRYAAMEYLTRIKSKIFSPQKASQMSFEHTSSFLVFNGKVKWDKNQIHRKVTSWFDVISINDLPSKLDSIRNKKLSLSDIESMKIPALLNLEKVIDTPIITSNDSLDSTGGISKQRLIHMSQSSGIAFKIPAALRQILEVIISIKKDGISRPDATKKVAERNNIRPQTVIDKYCRQLNLRAFEFDQLIAEEALINLKNLLKEKFPRYSNEIDNCLNDFPI